MPGWEIKKFWKYTKSKPKNGWTKKHFKVSNSKITEWKKSRINSKFRLAEIFSNFFQNIFSSTLKSMGFQCIYKVFEKEKGWEPSFPSQIKFTKAQKCYNSNPTKFYIQVQVQIIQDGWHDLWHMKTCDFLWKYQMIWSSYERIG